MRYLFTSMPVSSHLMPLVPLAHAAQAAGHEVLVATCGPARRTAVAAGLVTAEAGAARQARQPYDDLLRTLERAGAGSAPDDATSLAVHGRAFGEVGARMLDDLVHIARTWGADAVVYPGIHSAALVAARAAGVPAVLHGYGTPLPTFGPALDHLAPHAARAGVDKVTEAEIEIDVLPPSLANFTDVPTDIGRPAHHLAMRYGCFNNGGTLPHWALRPGEVPRVVATCGSSAAMTRDGALYRDIVHATGELGAELVLLTADAELPKLPAALPPHVRPERWVPLRALLDGCDAIVHHGGSGTVLSSFAAGVPQVSLPMPGTVNVSNARTVADRGAGRTLDIDADGPGAVTDALREVLRDPAPRRASREVAAEMAAMPAPAEVVARVGDLVAGGRG
ncbi:MULTISPECIES: glycosyltransferase [Streptomyces]|uniref:glycosyltransferase n=1 Tax=Streptomyces TaxID=1883 RepID=UPI002248D2AF|nr:glycosyltransferase [Streptomyces sp. JHD 1]MCX2968301.1 glycosyltransferase [Streptomyces sp. JHD 1]